jgi:HSP20 family molecular chaperone IbpA
MRKVFANKSVLAGFFFVLGLFTYWAGQMAYHRFVLARREAPPRPPMAHYPPGFGGAFDEEDEEMDPFVQMQRMQQQMLRGMAPGGGTGQRAGEVEEREDDKFVYYDIHVKGVDQNKLKVNIENGQITISGEIAFTPDDGEEGGGMISKFHRSFPAPPQTDAEKVQVESTKDKITLKFPKVS